MSSTSSDEFLQATISIAVAYLSKSTVSPGELAAGARGHTPQPAPDGAAGR